MSRAITRAQLDKVVRSITKFYPQKYADKSWDNTGLLIDCSTAQATSADANSKTKILLTVDLTKSVAQEAMDADCNVIIAYHPFIFPSWNRLNPLTNPQHETAIKLIQSGISVYCPHTAVDAARGGVNDWLVKGLNGGEDVAKSYALETVSGENDDLVGYGRFVEFNNCLLYTSCSTACDLEDTSLASVGDVVLFIFPWTTKFMTSSTVVG